MDRWIGKVAIVTGASVGIGAAITIDLLNAGVIVVGLARRVELIAELRNKVPESLAGALHAIKCDLTIESDILAAFEYTERVLGGADILINNAAILNTPGNLVDANNTAIMRQILDTNVLGLALCTREAFQSMKLRGVDGHVVMLSSVCGRLVPCLPGAGSLNMYVASKYALTAMAEQIRQEFYDLKTRIKISVSDSNSNNG